MSAPCLGTRAHPTAAYPHPSLDKALTSARMAKSTLLIACGGGTGEGPSGYAQHPTAYRAQNRSLTSCQLCETNTSLSFWNT